MTEVATAPVQPSVDPSLVAGSYLPEPTDPLERVQLGMKEVLPLFELGDDDFEQASLDFVNHRTDQLSEGVSHAPVGFINGGTDKFISPDTPMIVAGVQSRPYFLDDPAAVAASFPFIRDFYNQYKETMPPEKAYMNAVVQGTNLGQIKYFESYRGDPNRIAGITAYFLGDDNLPQLSIADLKQAAMCQERSGITHNALAIFGITSKFQMGMLSVENEDGTATSEPHGFLTVTSTDGSTFLYDPTNPVLLRNTEGEIVNATASIYRIADTDTPFRGNITERTTQPDGTQVTTRTRPISYTFTIEN